MDFTKSDPRAITPTHANSFDSGWDLYALEDITVRPGEVLTVPTGIHIAQGSDCAGYIHDKSSRGAAGLKVLGGVIDMLYVGEIKVVVANLNTFALLSALQRLIVQKSNFYNNLGSLMDQCSIIIPYGKAIAQICFHQIYIPDNFSEISPPVFRERYAPRFAADQRGEGGFGSSSSPDGPPRRGGPEFNFSPLD